MCTPEVESGERSDTECAVICFQQIGGKRENQDGGSLKYTVFPVITATGSPDPVEQRKETQSEGESKAGILCAGEKEGSMQRPIEKRLREHSEHQNAQDIVPDV